jgi:hypothetical protein
MDSVAVAPGHGNRLPGQGRLVESRAGTENDAVDGYDFPRANEDGIADRHGIDRNILDLIVGAPVGDPRCAIYERLEVALSTGDCEVFEHVAASVHDGNYGTSERLTEQQGRGHGNEGDSIDAHASGEETPHHR